MISKNDLLQELKDKTVTLGWDAISIFDRSHVNMVMEQQYVKKMANGTHFPLISKTVVGDGGSQKIILDSLLFGPPLVSFEASNIESSYVKARLELVSGTVTLLGEDDAISRVDEVNSVNGYVIELKVALEKVEGSVDNQGKVQINFASSSLLEVSFPGMQLPAIVIDYFRNYFMDNPVSYVINTIDVSGDNILTPQKFIVRTQPAPGALDRNSASYGNGAVLVFIATKANPSGGNYPANTFPWLLPTGHSSTLIVSSSVLINNFVKPQIEGLFDKSSWVVERVNESNADSAFCLKAHSVEMPNDPAVFDNVSSKIWTGHVGDSNKMEEENYSLVLNGCYLKPDVNGLALSAEKNEIFDIDFGVKATYCTGHPAGGTVCYDKFYEKTLALKFDGEINYKSTLNDQNEVAIVSADGYLLLENRSLLPSWWENDWGEAIFDRFSNEANDEISRLKEFTLADIKVSLVSHVIFSEEIEVRFSDVYIPGDIVLFGELAPKSTAFRIDPLRSVVGLNDTRQFTVSPEKSVNWSISPSFGSINALTGLYTAPGGSLMDDKTITVSATGTEGAVTKASIILSGAATALSPNYIAIKEHEDKAVAVDTLDFSWFSTNGKLATSWSMDSSLPEDARGTISAEGKYTLPATITNGAHIVRVKAQDDESKAAFAYICLKSKRTKDEVEIDPPTPQSIRAGETVEFLATSYDFELGNNSWSFYPENVGEWQWEALENVGDDENVYTYRVRYTAPDIITQREMVFVTAKLSTRRYGIGVVMLEPGANNWDLVTSIEELSVSLLSGSDKGSLFANGRNQLPVAIHIKGLNNNEGDEEVPLSLGDVINHIELVDYYSGEPLRYEESRGWFYKSTKNEFQTLPDAFSKNLHGNNLLYVMCEESEPVRTKRVALRVTLTSPDADKKVYWTGLNSGGFDSSVVINAKEPIDYSNKDNLRIIDNALQTISQPMEWGYRRGKYFAKKTNGNYFKKKVHIQPANVSRFYSVTIEQHAVWNADLLPKVIQWNGENVPSFSCIEGSGAAPAAVYATNKRAHTIDDEYTELNLWYTQQRSSLDVKIKGDAYFNNASDPEYYGQFMRANLLDKGVLTETNGSVSFYLYKLQLGLREGDDENETPKINLNGKPNHWQKSVQEIKVSVTDIYGNSGVFTVYWNDVNDNSNNADILLIK